MTAKRSDKSSTQDLNPVPLSLDMPIDLMRQLCRDIKVPVTALNTSLDMLLEGAYDPLTPKQTRATQRIRYNSQRLLALIEEFTIYLKAEADQLTIASAAFDIRTVLNEACALVKPFADQKALSFQITINAAVPCVLLGDDDLIRRIILALLWNAVAFTVKGDICLTADQLPGGQWQITVKDTGPGIAQEHVQHIFAPFWRGDERPQVPTAGCGLGLALASALAKKMGGSLYLKETGAGGSIFCLYLPLATYTGI
jgi:signal transduction histidine kinase